MTIFELLKLLEENHIFYTLERPREDSVLVNAVVPGERWEIEVFCDGHIETERFVTTAEIGDEKALQDLIKRFGE